MNEHILEAIMSIHCIHLSRIRFKFVLLRLWGLFYDFLGVAGYH